MFKLLNDLTPVGTVKLLISMTELQRLFSPHIKIVHVTGDAAKNRMEILAVGTADPLWIATRGAIPDTIAVLETVESDSHSYGRFTTPYDNGSPVKTLKDATPDELLAALAEKMPWPDNGKDKEPPSQNNNS